MNDFAVHRGNLYSHLKSNYNPTRKTQNERSGEYTRHYARKQHAGKHHAGCQYGPIYTRRSTEEVFPTRLYEVRF